MPDGASLADGILQLTGAGFEYPRSDLRAPLHLVGPVLPTAKSFEKPYWWGDLDDDRPVVHVTQGTVANGDLEALLLPTVRALADRDVLVVSDDRRRGDRRDAAGICTREHQVAAFLPYDALLPKVDVTVTNGGNGGLQFALAHGVPLVMAGDTEEKPEIAARVVWSGVRISLRTSRPSQDAVARAVDKILTAPRYRSRAAQMRTELASCAPLQSIDDAVRAAAARTVTA